MSYESGPNGLYIEQFLLMKFYDANGIVSHLGQNTTFTDVYFSNQDVLNVEVSTKYAGEVAETAGGYSHGYAKLAPEKWTLSPRIFEPDGLGNYRLRILHWAIENEWRVWAQIQSGFLLHDWGFRRLVDSPREMWCTIRTGHDSYQNVLRGHGLENGKAKQFELIETIETLTVPTGDPRVAIQDVSIGGLAGIGIAGVG